MNHEPDFQRRSLQTAGAIQLSDADPIVNSIHKAPVASGASIPLSTPKWLAVQFQGPSSTNSPNHIALAGSIAGVVVLLLAFVLWEFHRMRRRRRKFAQSDAEAAQVPVNSGRNEKSNGFPYANLPSTTHLPPPPPPAYYSTNYGPR